MSNQFSRPPGTSERLLPEELEPDPRMYVQLAALIRSEIDDGTQKPGEFISITTLHEQHGVARQTAAKALRALEDEEYVKRWTGYGYRICPRDEQQPLAGDNDRA